MNNFDIYLFDLDGTLTDPAEGITNSVAYALNKFGITVESREELYKFIGPPLVNSFMEYYGFDKEKAFLAVETYREYFRDKGIFENKLYDDIPLVLEKLQQDGKIIVLATSKPEEFAIKILKHFGLFEYFDLICGATMDEKRSEKSDIIKYALKKLNAPIEKCVMIGDRCYDILGAKENGIASIGVTYGYGSLEELKNSGADYIIDKPIELI